MLEIVTGVVHDNENPECESGGEHEMQGFEFAVEDSSSRSIVADLMGGLDSCSHQFLREREETHRRPKLGKFLAECLRKLGPGVFILNGEEDICKHPNATLVVPGCKDEAIIKALEVAARCHKKGNALIAIIFVIDTWKPSMKESLRHAWQSAEVHGVRLITEYIIH